VEEEWPSLLLRIEDIFGIDVRSLTLDPSTSRRQLGPPIHAPLSIQTPAP
jgi:hypothetical protein